MPVPVLLTFPGWQVWHVQGGAQPVYPVPQPSHDCQTCWTWPERQQVWHYQQIVWCLPLSGDETLAPWAPMTPCTSHGEPASQLTAVACTADASTCAAKTHKL